MGKLELARAQQELHEKGMKAEKTLAVCPISGVYMSSTDNEQRTHDHLNGKQYQGWKVCGSSLNQLSRRRAETSSESGARLSPTSRLYSLDASEGGGRGCLHRASARSSLSCACRSRPREAVAAVGGDATVRCVGLQACGSPVHVALVLASA
jgi:hypothetical protein